MAEKFISERNIKFLLYEVLDSESLLKFDRYKDHSREIFDMAIDAGLKLGRDLFYPCFSEMDKKQPRFEGGTTKVLPVVRTIMREMGEGGWIGAGASYDVGGQQMPMTVMAAFRFILSAANYSATVYPTLSSGAAHLIESFGSEEMKKTYIPKLFGGQWQGTMALTEPQAGSSLTDIATTAEPTPNGYYKIKGQKIFISGGDHDGVDNVVHLMLARIKGAPPGIKGISLFVVPKLRIKTDGGLESNDLNLAGIYHKLGYRGAPITQLSIGENGDCRAWLVGNEHQGLKYMFQMMNEARIDVGAGACGIAMAAYYASLQYTKERLQGRNITSKDPTQPQIPIIKHADVKRMLLFQRAVVEGSLSLILYCSKLSDMAHFSGKADNEREAFLLEILTPIAKSYPSEMGILSASQGLQCLGGYGYCDEFPLEQYYRDARIHPIHEGATAIQGMDLLGRKVVMKNGKALMFYLDEVGATVAKGKKIDALKDMAAQLEKALETLKDVTVHLTGLALKGQVELFLADATLYLEMFGIITIAWQWLLMAVCADEKIAKCASDADRKFYSGKYYTAKYFFEYELPKIAGLATRLKSSDGLTVEMKEEFFED